MARVLLQRDAVVKRSDEHGGSLRSRLLPSQPDPQIRPDPTRKEPFLAFSDAGEVGREEGVHEITPVSSWRPQKEGKISRQIIEKFST